MPPTRQNLTREIFRSILFQVLRGLLWGWTARLIAKGYLTSGQAEYLLLGLASILITAVSVVATSFFRYARSEALRRAHPDDSKETIRRSMWRVLWQLLNIQPLEGDHLEPAKSNT